VSSALNTSTSVGLSVSQLVIKYGNVTAVDHVSFTAQPGRVTVILGPNGAGKTSTIEACEGFLAPTAGSVQVLGLNPFLQRKQLNRQMGIMLQDGGIYPSARVGELVQQYCALYGNGVDANALIARVGLQAVASTTYRRLSGGEKQRLSLALALAALPKIIFLDEPTSGIDVNGRDLVRSIIRELRDSDCCVIVATHELDEAERIADDVLVFHRGNVVASGTLHELRSGREEIRFRSHSLIDVHSLSTTLGYAVEQTRQSEFTVAGTSDSRVIVQLTDWAKANNVDIGDIGAGSQRLDDVFRRLTAEPAS
jgi:ABC-2 type transport system ATP-binding protein